MTPPVPRWSLVLAACGLVATVAVLLDPALEAAFPMHRVGMEYLIVGALGAVTCASAGVLLGLRSRRGVTETKPPRVETADRGRPEDIVEATLDSLPLLRVTEAHRRFHEQLYEITVSVVVHRHGCSRNRAKDRLREGTWTDDRVAGEFLRSSEFAPPPIHRRVFELLTGRRWYRRRVLATVRALERLDGEV